MATPKRKQSSPNKKKAVKARKTGAPGNVKIPRTHSAAKKLGYAPVKVNFRNLSESLRANFAEFEGAGSGTICGMGPSTDPSYWLVCYKDDNGMCDWRHVPRGMPLAEHQ